MAKLEKVISRDHASKLLKTFQSLIDYEGEKFSYFVSRNIGKLSSVVSSIQKYSEKIRPEKTERLAEFMEKENELYMKYSVHINGKPVPPRNGSYNIDESRTDEFMMEKEEFENSYRDIINNFDDINKRISEFANGEVVVEFTTIKRSLLPANITARNRIEIEEFIIDDIDFNDENDNGQGSV